MCPLLCQTKNSAIVFESRLDHAEAEISWWVFVFTHTCPSLGRACVGSCRCHVSRHNSATAEPHLTTLYSNRYNDFRKGKSFIFKGGLWMTSQRANNAANFSAFVVTVPQKWEYTRDKKGCPAKSKLTFVKILFAQKHVLALCLSPGLPSTGKSSELSSRLSVHMIGGLERVRPSAPVAVSYSLHTHIGTSRRSASRLAGACPVLDKDFAPDIPAWAPDVCTPNDMLPLHCNCLLLYDSPLPPNKRSFAASVSQDEKPVSVPLLAMSWETERCFHAFSWRLACCENEELNRWDGTKTQRVSNSIVGQRRGSGVLQVRRAPGAAAVSGTCRALQRQEAGKETGPGPLSACHPTHR